MEQELESAIERDDATFVTQWLEQRGYVDFIDQTGESCLGMACRHRSRAVVEALLQRGAPLDVLGVWPSPLVHAVESGDEAIVQRLLDAGADAGSETWHEDADLPLLSAVRDRHWSIASRLVQAGAIEKADAAWLPEVIEATLAGKGKGRSRVLAEIFTHTLSRFGDSPVPVHDRLLKKAASLLKRDAGSRELPGRIASSVDEKKALEEEILDLYTEQEKPEEAMQLLRDAPPALRSHLAAKLLKHAIWEKRPDHVDELLTIIGNDVNVSGEGGATPLMWAAYDKNLPVVRELAARGAQIRRGDNDHTSVLEWARLGGDQKIIEYLQELILQSAPDVDARDDERIARLRGDALQRELDRAAVEAASENRWDRVEQLLARGAGVNGRGRGGRTVLMYAASAGDRARIDQLLARGADVYAKDDRGYTVPTHAAGSGDDELYEYLFSLSVAKFPDVEALLDGYEPTVVKLTGITNFSVFLYGIPDSWPAAYRGELRLKLDDEEKLRLEVSIGVRMPRTVSLMFSFVDDWRVEEMRGMFRMPALSHSVLQRCE
ncbi:MAG TPA: ankyrin repeat domain-containing protein [Thermoanaerobaculia bacterium]|nr:ankyrin repeat domain-containing protein [Thermoanaerobaculia bacterium]